MVTIVAKDSQIECQVTGVEVGGQLVQVSVEGVGLAKASAGYPCLIKSIRLDQIT